jgi:tryptophanyl-tRNA synthetase
MNKPVILTGLRATNDLHIGNYFGALLPLIDMAKTRSKDFQINIFMPDLHSFTTPIDHAKLQDQIKNTLKQFVAAGLPLDNDSVYIYRQSYVPAHSELTIILNSFTGVGELSRMTQYKDKSAKIGKDRISAGLFDYPVLMACDILLYSAQYIPVGDDQTQHIEFTRDLAGAMNGKFNQNLFVVPRPVKEQHEFFKKDQGLRIMDLSDPLKKMSKSDNNEKGVILLVDSSEEANKKVMSAVTDGLGKITYDPGNQPGVSNLLQILALLEEKPLKDIVARFEGQSQYGPLKEAVSSAVGIFLKDYQEKLANVDEKVFEAKLKSSETAMNKVANETLERVQKAVGLR